MLLLNTVTVGCPCWATTQGAVWPCCGSNLVLPLNDVRLWGFNCAEALAQQPLRPAVVVRVLGAQVGWHT